MLFEKSILLLVAAFFWLGRCDEPISYLLYRYYTDQSCLSPTGRVKFQPYGECEVGYSNDPSPRHTTGTSSKLTLQTNGNVVTNFHQKYLDTACTTLDTSSSGSSSGSSYTLAACTADYPSSPDTIYFKVTQFNVAPTLDGAYTIGYRSSSECSSKTAATYGEAFLVDTCFKFESATDSRKVTVKGGTTTIVDYSDGDCKTETKTTIQTQKDCGDGSTINYYDGSTAFITTGCTTCSTGGNDKKDAQCFGSFETVQLEDGSVKALRDAQLGDRILTAELSGSIKGYSAVIAVPHAGDEGVRTTFAQLSTVSGKDVRMTRSHLVLAGSCSLSSLPLVQAGSVKAGDCVQTVSGKEQVTAVSMVQGQGIASAVTAAGNLIVVNGVVASPFAVNHAAPEAWYSIHRLVYALFPALLGNKLFQQTSERFGDLSVQFSL